MRRFALLVAGLALLASVAAASSGGATQVEAHWVITDLGTLGGKESYAAAINAKGQVVGWAKTKKGRTHPFLWQSGRMRDLGAMDHPSAWATAINDRGQIIGQFQAVWNDEYEGYASAQLGFVWERGFMTGLTPDPDGYLDTPDDGGTEVRALNERGQMVGSADAEYYEPHAYLWKKPDFSERGSSYPYHHEGTFLTTRQLSAAYDINEHDQAVGESQASYKAPLHAALWENGQLTDLGTLGGVSSSARAINDNGQVVGRSLVATSRWHAFIWREEASSSWRTGRKGFVLLLALSVFASVAILLGASWLFRHFVSRSWSLLAILLFVLIPGLLTVTSLGVNRWHDSPSLMRDLGTLPGSLHSYATALNERGEVIGWGSTTAGTDDEGVPPTPRAFLWEDGEMRDLGTLGGDYSIAFAINESGRVVGQSQAASGRWHSFVWENGTMTALPTLGGKFSAALAINDAGQIVGWSRTSKDVKHAVLWTLKRG